MKYETEKIIIHFGFRKQFFENLFLVGLALKFTGHIDFSVWVILMPLWLPALLQIAAVLSKIVSNAIIKSKQ